MSDRDLTLSCTFCQHPVWVADDEPVLECTWCSAVWDHVGDLVASPVSILLSHFAAGAIRINDDEESGR